MVQAYKNWERGLHPVSTGRAPWLPGLFEEAVDAIADLISEHKAAEDEARRG